MFPENSSTSSTFIFKSNALLYKKIMYFLQPFYTKSEMNKPQPEGNASASISLSIVQHEDRRNVSE